MGAFQSDSFKGRERLFVFELWDGEVKVWTSRGAGDEAKRSVVGKDTAIEDSFHKVITGAVSGEAEVELLCIHLLWDVAHADRTLYIHAGK